MVGWTGWHWSCLLAQSSRLVTDSDYEWEEQKGWGKDDEHMGQGSPCLLPSHPPKTQLATGHWGWCQKPDVLSWPQKERSRFCPEQGPKICSLMQTQAPSTHSLAWWKSTCFATQVPHFHPHFPTFSSLNLVPSSLEGARLSWIGKFQGTDAPGNINKLPKCMY